MANLKEIRNRITSISSTMQITSAMKMVSAAKLKRAQDAVTQMRPYAGKLQEILENLSATLDLSENAYSDQREVKNVLVVGITSNRGLCGGFNNNIIKRVNHLVEGERLRSSSSPRASTKQHRTIFRSSRINSVNTMPPLYAKTLANSNPCCASTPLLITRRLPLKKLRRTKS
jgi:F-type H+-transporting ATPase subunit gamma